jgi:hypothetical protein
VNIEHILLLPFNITVKNVFFSKQTKPRAERNNSRQHNSAKESMDIGFAKMQFEMLHYTIETHSVEGGKSDIRNGCKTKSA